MPSNACFHFSEQEGLIEPCKRLGEPVSQGEVPVQIYPINRTGLATAEYRAEIDGILVARHFPGMCLSGDCIAVLATA